MKDVNIIHKINRTDFAKLFKSKGYVFFDKGEYNLNIIGVRKSGNLITNGFDDYIVVIYKNKRGWQKIYYRATTEPGSYYMYTVPNKIGTAIMVPGQYRGAYKIGKHQGKYKALVQVKPVKVYRDANKDSYYDMEPETIQNGVFGINIHKAGNASKRIDKWSAGCQVIANDDNFRAFMQLCEKAAKIYGDTFTYTLINEEDLE
jgi:hypothetical protein